MQNNKYWALLREMSRVSKDYDAETWHFYFCQKFLPRVERELPDWSTRLVQVTTHDLPMHPDQKDLHKPNWQDYYGQVEAFCAEHGAYLQDG
mgnify:CR=1 FL=1